MLLLKIQFGRNSNKITTKINKTHYELFHTSFHICFLVLPFFQLCIWVWKIRVPSYRWFMWQKGNVIFQTHIQFTATYVTALIGRYNKYWSVSNILWKGHIHTNESAYIQNRASFCKDFFLQPSQFYIKSTNCFQSEFRAFKNIALTQSVSNSARIVDKNRQTRFSDTIFWCCS